MTALLTTLIFVCLYLPAVTQTPVTADGVVAKMASAYAENRTHLRPYVLTRRYLVLKSGQQKTKVIAAIIYLPPEANTFEIRDSTGGKAEGVVRKMLDKEMQLSRDFQASGFNIANYEFQFLGEERLAGADCYLLAIHPKRTSKDLMDGKIWVDKALYLVRRVQGRPMKSPSWWVKDVLFTVDYGSVEGMWLQVGSSGEARVRFAGKYTLTSEKIAFGLLQNDRGAHDSN